MYTYQTTNEAILLGKCNPATELLQYIQTLMTAYQLNQRLKIL